MARSSPWVCCGRHTAPARGTAARTNLTIRPLGVFALSAAEQWRLLQNARRGSVSQRFAARGVLSATVFLGGWGVGLLAGFGSAGTENVQAVSIEDRGWPYSIKPLTA